MPKQDTMTPVRRQYLDLKARYPGAILFFRMGDFYETFDEDAKVVAEEVDIALTSRPWGGIRLDGALSRYIRPGVGNRLILVSV